jgi:hypothetical protein
MTVCSDGFRLTVSQRQIVIRAWALVKATRREIGCVNGSRKRPMRISKLAGGDTKVIADQAGHDTAVSVNVYTQSPVESKLKVVSAVEKLIFG